MTLKELFDAWDDAVNDVWQWRLIEDPEEEAQAMEVVNKLRPKIAAAIDMGDAAIKYALAVEAKVMTILHYTDHDIAAAAESKAWQEYIKARDRQIDPPPPKA